MTAPLDLRFATDFFGELSEESADLLQYYMRIPCAETWDRIKGIIVQREGMTSVWKAVLAVVPGFPQTGRSYDASGRMLTDWAAIPTPEQLRMAIDYATR